MYVILKNYVNWCRENTGRAGKTQGIRKYNLSGYPGVAIFPDFSGIPDFHKSRLSMKNL